MRKYMYFFYRLLHTLSGVYVNTEYKPQISQKKIILIDHFDDGKFMTTSCIYACK